MDGSEKDTFILPRSEATVEATANAVAATIAEAAVSVVTTEPDDAVNPLEATLQEFNRNIIMALTAPSEPMPQPKVKPTRLKSEQGARLKGEQDPAHREKRPRDTEVAVEEEPDKSAHLLLPNLGRGRILCRLCSKRGLKTRTRYGCVQCRLGFHVECFAVFHHPTAFNESTSESVQDALDVLQRRSPSRPATRRRLNNSIRSIEQLELPTVSDEHE